MTSAKISLAHVVPLTPNADLPSGATTEDGVVVTVA
jgi:hypothetical protein